ncbi:hypothetical protein HS125_07845 [bacterium]|nr:hypothetical protein [bacterium]
MTSGDWFVFFFVLAVVLWTYRYAALGGQVGRSRWLALVALRVGAVVLIVWLLSGPTQQETMQQEEHSYFPILIDDSKSMQLAGSAGGTRAAEAASLVWDATGLAGRLSGGRLAAPVLRLSDLSPLSPASASGRTIPPRTSAEPWRAQRNLETRGLAGVVLISDGRDHGDLRYRRRIWKPIWRSASARIAAPRPGRRAVLPAPSRQRQ